MLRSLQLSLPWICFLTHSHTPHHHFSNQRFYQSGFLATRAIKQTKPPSRRFRFLLQGANVSQSVNNNSELNHKHGAHLSKQPTFVIDLAGLFKVFRNKLTNHTNQRTHFKLELYIKHFFLKMSLMQTKVILHKSL